MKGQLNKEYKNRMTCKVSDSDIYEIEKLAMLWGLDRSDIVRIAVKKFLQDPTLDFTLDAKESKEELRVTKQKNGWSHGFKL